MNLGDFMRLASLASIDRPIVQQVVQPVTEIHTTEVREIHTLVEVPAPSVVAPAPVVPVVQKPQLVQVLPNPTVLARKANSFLAENPGHYIDEETGFMLQWETIKVDVASGGVTTPFVWTFPKEFTDCCAIAWALPANYVGSLASIGHGATEGPFWNKKEARGGADARQAVTMMISCFAIGR